MTRELSNTEKAALTLVSMGKDLASAVLQHLNEAEVKRISRAFMAVHEVDRETQFAITREFHSMMKASETMLVDGREFAKDVISTAFGEQAGEGLIEYISGSRKEPIGTIIQDVLSWLKKHGVTEVVINLHYLGEQIRRFVEEGGGEGLKISFSEETEILGTGGGLQKAESFFSCEKDFLVVNADIYSDLNLGSLVKCLRSSPGTLAALSVMIRQDESYLVFDGEGSMCGFQNKKAEKTLVRPVNNEMVLAFCGIQALSQSVFQFMEGLKPPFSLIDVYLKAASAGAVVRSFRSDNCYWIDMGSKEKLEQLEKHLFGQINAE